MTALSFWDLLLATYEVMIDGHYAGYINHLDYPIPEYCWVTTTDDDRELGCSSTFGDALGGLVHDWSNYPHRRPPTTITVRTAYVQRDSS